MVEITKTIKFCAWSAKKTDRSCAKNDRLKSFLPLTEKYLPLKKFLLTRAMRLKYLCINTNKININQ